jgi:hypothetical protein
MTANAPVANSSSGAAAVDGSEAASAAAGTDGPERELVMAAAAAPNPNPEGGEETDGEEAKEREAAYKAHISAVVSGGQTSGLTW